MKKSFLILLFSISFIVSFGQGTPNRASCAITAYDCNLGAVNSFRIPIFNDTIQPASNVDSLGIMMYRKIDSSVYVRVPASGSVNKWIKLLKTGNAINSVSWGQIIGTLSNQTDLQNALNLKLNISDTASMLNVYLRAVGYGLLKSGHTVSFDSATVFPQIRATIPVSTANNGLSNSGSNIVLGQDYGAMGNPAALSSIRQIPMNGNPIFFTGAGSTFNAIVPTGTHIVGDSATTTPATLLLEDGLSANPQLSIIANPTYGDFSFGNQHQLSLTPDGFTNINDSLRILKIATGLSTDSVLVKGTDGVVRKVAQAGVGSTFYNSNIGSFYRLAVPNTNNIKTLAPGYGILNDSTSNSNAITQKADTATLFPAVRATIDTLFLDIKYFGAKGDGITDDAPAIQNAFNWIKNNPSKTYQIFFPPGNYKQNSTVQLPQRINTTAENVRINIIGYGATILTTSSISLWERLPATQTIATDSLISNWIGNIEGLTFLGNSTTGQLGLRIGATYSWSIHNCTFINLDTALVSDFGLQLSCENLRFTQNLSENILIGDGERWGGTQANSASNSNSFRNCRVYGASGAYSHFHADAANGIVIDNFISEGFKPKYNFIIDAHGSSTVKFCDIRNLHLEANGGVYGFNTVFKLVPSGGTFNISNVYLQYPDTLFNSIGSGSSSQIVFNGIPYTAALPSGVAFNAGGGGALGYDIIFKNIPGGATFKSKLYNTASWNGGVLPYELYFDYTDGSGSGAASLSSGGDINLRPGSSGLTKKVNFDAIINFSLDDNYAIGGTYNAAQNRPSTGWFGTTGVFVAPTYGKIGFGTNIGTVDYMDNPLGGIYRFNGTGQMRLPIGTTAQRLTGGGGDFRSNIDSSGLPEYYNGSSWQALADRNWVRSNVSNLFGYQLTNGTPGTDSVVVVKGGVLEKVAAANIPNTVVTGDHTGLTAADTVINYTVGASDGTFQVNAYSNITSVATDILVVQLVFTDENNAGKSLSFYPMGTTTPNLTTTGFSAFPAICIKAKAGTPIYLLTTLVTGGSINYDFGGAIVQLK